MQNKNIENSTVLTNSLTRRTLAGAALALTVATGGVGLANKGSSQPKETVPQTEIICSPIGTTLVNVEPGDTLSELYRDDLDRVVVAGMPQAGDQVLETVRENMKIIGRDGIPRDSDGELSAGRSYEMPVDVACGKGVVSGVDLANR
jgi:hypothetical protein